MLSRFFRGQRVLTRVHGVQQKLDGDNKILPKLHDTDKAEYGARIIGEGSVPNTFELVYDADSA